MSASRFGADRGGWVLAQQAVTRGAAAGKFYFTAWMFGPEAFGWLTVALIAVAIAEAVSDTGVPSAIIQASAKPTAGQLSACFCTLLARGSVVAFVLWAGSAFIARFFAAPRAMELVALAAAVPLVRGLLSPGLYVAQRNRRFRTVFAIDCVATIVDLAVLAWLASGQIGVGAAIWATICAELARVGLSWLFTGTALTLRGRGSELSGYARFAGWVWLANVATVLLNNLDRWLIARALGPAELAAYHLAHKAAQLCVAEPAGALHAYLFPTFAGHARRSLDAARELFVMWRNRLAFGTGLAALLLASIAEPLLGGLLGPDWARTAQLCKWMVVPLWLSGMLNVHAQFAKAIGRPDGLAKSTGLQLIVLAALGVPTIGSAGALGMIAVVTVSSAIGLAVLARVARVGP